ncbi:MAG: ABC transporter substrate-binding protein [Planctomycetota bacterium]|nr:ABC transporter substrate-binding protein [Planctomycetota bacterium]
MGIGTIVRRVLVSAGALALVAFLAGYRPADVSDGGRRQVIQVWHPWGGPILESYQRGVELFQKTHPTIGCKLLYIPNDLSNSQKFYTAVIGNCAPDVTFVDGPQVAEWAERGLLTPLDELLREAGEDPEKLRQEFFEPCWKQCVYRGKVYAITYCADPNFCFFWNKAAIRKALAAGEVPAGAVDPEKAPATIEELDRCNDAVTKVRQTGAGEQLERIGLVPWGVYGHANSIFTWGWAFGGEFYDPVTDKITASDPKVVKALEWMCQYARKYNYEHISTLQSSFGSAEQNPFIVGKQVMQLLHLSGIADLEQYAPHLEYGLAPIPQPPGGEYNSSWVGGWTLAIPAGVTDPARRQAALEFILWSCAKPEGTTMDVRTSRNFPGWKPSSFFQDAKKDPRFAMFVQILENCKHQRPVMPAQAFYMNELARAVDKAVRAEKKPDGTPYTAKELLDEATQRTQKYLDRIRARKPNGE